jgi:hypothetical protein
MLRLRAGRKLDALQAVRCMACAAWRALHGAAVLRGGLRARPHAAASCLARARSWLIHARCPVVDVHEHAAGAHARLCARAPT